MKWDISSNGLFKKNETLEKILYPNPLIVYLLYARNNNMIILLKSRLEIWCLRWHTLIFWQPAYN